MKQELILRQEIGDQLHIYHAAGGNPFLQVDPGMIIWTWVVFFLLLGVLYKFAWKPILKGLDKREKIIQDSLDNAEKIEANVKEMNEQNAEILKQARLESKAIVDSAREVSEKNKEAAKAKTAEEVADMLSKARSVIEQEKKLAIEQLKQESVQISVEIASKLMEENLDNQKNVELSKKYLDRVSKY